MEANASSAGFSSCPVYLNGISGEYLDKRLCLPSGSNMSENERAVVLNVFIEYFNK